MSSEAHSGGHSTPPSATGVRLPWSAVPARIRDAVENQLGAQVIEAISQAGGFSPGVAARLRLADDRRAFVKAVGPDANPDTPRIYRREAQIAAVLPPSAPAPPLLWTYDEGEAGWIVLLFADIDGCQPAQPWRPDELKRVLAALAELGAALTPSPLPEVLARTASEAFADHIRGWRQLRDEQPIELAALDPWAAANMERLITFEERSPAAVVGDTLLHFDVRADNVLLTDERVWFVDWPHARIGAAWLDALALAPSVTMQGGPPQEEVLARHPAAASADPEAITAAVVALAGYFTQRGLQPPPPGLPTVRAF